MELVSPIIYKKLDFEKFDKIGQTSVNSSVFYDKYSKNLVQFSDDNIKIFNKRATNLKKNLNLKLSKYTINFNSPFREKINQVAVDKNIKYMIVLVDNKMSLIINLRNEKVCEILHYDFTTLLGIFFMQNMSQTQNNDDVNFAMVFVDKLVYFKIFQGSQTDKVIEYKTIKFVSSSVNNFYFNLRYSILVLEKKENTFDFYNLSSEKYYSKAHPFNYPTKNLRKEEGRSSISKFFGIFRSSASKKMNENILLDGYQQKEILYKKNHFFLETLYKKLYFLCLNYNEAEIQIFHVENLMSIKKVKTIVFENSQISTLQFIDNLILLHNFERCDTIVIDLKSESSEKVICKIFSNFIVKNFPMTNFDLLQQNSELCSEVVQPQIILDEEGNVSCRLDYNFIETISMLSYNNRMFYEKNLSIKGTIIIDRDDGQHYVCYFDPMIYYENVHLKYEAVFNLIRRKNSKDVIIHALFEMIKGCYSIKILKFIFNKIVKQLHKNIFNKKNLGGNQKQFGINQMLIVNANDVEEKRNSYELLNPKHFILLRKRTIVKQPDLYYNLFKPFEYKTNIDVEYIFKLLVHFVNSLLSYGIPVQPSFHSIMVIFLRKIKHISFLGIFLQYHSIPDSVELARFLIEEYAHLEDYNNIFQSGLDMLTRLQKYEEVFTALINKNMLMEALLFMKRYKVNMEYISSDASEILKKLISDNPRLVSDYLSNI